jgi:hypothetical protein
VAPVAYVPLENQELTQIQALSCRVVVTSGRSNQIVRVLMGVIKDRHGTYYARKTVPVKPAGLRVAVARELDNGKAVQAHLKRSLGTKDRRPGSERGKPKCCPGCEHPARHVRCVFQYLPTVAIRTRGTTKAVGVS